MQGTQIWPLVGQLKIPRATEELNVCAATTEPVAQLESPWKIPHDTRILHAATKTTHSQINKYIFLKKR